MALRFDGWLSENTTNQKDEKIRVYEKFTTSYKDYMGRNLTMLLNFDMRIWRDAILGLNNFNTEISKKVQELIIYGVSKVCLTTKFDRYNNC